MKRANRMGEKGKERSVTVVVLKRLLPYLAAYRKRFFAAIGAMVLYGATDGALPFLIKYILDKIFGAQDEQWLIPLAVGIVVFAAFRGFFGFLQKYLSATVGLFIVRDLRNDINAKLLRLSPGFYSEQQTGSLISRITNDTLFVRMTLTDAAAVILRDSIRVVAILCAAVYLDPTLALIALIGFPLGILPVIKFGRRVRKLSRVGQDQFGGLTSILQETIIGHKVVQAFSMEEKEQARFADENDNLTKTFAKAEKYGAMSGPTNEVIACVAIALIILYGGMSVIGGVRTQGDFIAFLASLFLLYEPVKKISRVNNVVQQGVAASLRIFEVLDAKSDVDDSENASDLDSSEEYSISYEDVFFRYTGEQYDPSLSREWVLDDVAFDIKAGQTVALVGMSGGGKSTIADLLARFYDPVKGCVKINGQNIKELKLSSLRDKIALVNQHTFLFNDTVHNNIGYGVPSISRDEVIEAAKAANAHDFISRMPEGYDTVIGEQGLRLSGGERQRIAIARALLKNSPILILDEATAALDSESERLVQQAIDKLMAGRTVLVIAHRLATIRKADKILVVVDGKVVEQGSHDLLLESNGEYAKLYNMQFCENKTADIAAVGAG